MKPEFDCWCSYMQNHQLVREKVAQDTMYSPTPPRTLSIIATPGSEISQTSIGDQLNDFRVDFPPLVREDTGGLVPQESWVAARVVVRANADLGSGIHLVELLEVIS